MAKNEGVKTELRHLLERKPLQSLVVIVDSEHEPALRAAIEEAWQCVDASSVNVSRGDARLCIVRVDGRNVDAPRVLRALVEVAESQAIAVGAPILVAAWPAGARSWSWRPAGKLDAEKAAGQAPILPLQPTGRQRLLPRRLHRILGAWHREERVLAQLRAQPSVTRRELASKLGLSDSGIKYHLEKLKAAGVIRHVGATKSGYWEVLK